ncbi:MAG: protein tyrosine phosphatase family protein [Desulfobulbaceae bacterium]|nr:protein tyrosine phosphatase family protein [Desulfobulbaceae bacterium]
MATAGQPSETQLRKVAAERFEVVINLGLLDPRYCLPDEASLVQSLGLEYHHIPVSFQAPQLENLQRFFSVMDAVQGKKVFVHCAANKRVSSFVAFYGEARLGWAREKANAFISRIWQHDESWASFIALARQEQ